MKLEAEDERMERLSGKQSNFCIVPDCKFLNYRHSASGTQYIHSMDGCWLVCKCNRGGGCANKPNIDRGIDIGNGASGGWSFLNCWKCKSEEAVNGEKNNIQLNCCVHFKMRLLFLLLSVGSVLLLPTSIQQVVLLAGWMVVGHTRMSAR